MVIEALRLLPGWHCAIVGTTLAADAAELTEQAAGLGVGDRLHLLPGVPSAQVSGYIGTANVGVHPLPSGLRNHELALPNKLFEYVFAGLPVAVSDLPEMHRFVRSTQTGTVFDPSSPVSVATALRAATQISVDPDQLRPYAWARQAKRLVDLYGRLVPAPTGGTRVTRAMTSPLPEASRRRRVVMLVANDVSADTRVKKTALTLATAGFEVVVIGLVRSGARSESRLGRGPAGPPPRCSAASQAGQDAPQVSTDRSSDEATSDRNDQRQEAAAARAGSGDGPAC